MTRFTYLSQKQNRLQKYHIKILHRKVKNNGYNNHLIKILSSGNVGIMNICRFITEEDLINGT